MGETVHLEGRAHKQTNQQQQYYLNNNKSKSYEMRKTSNYETLLKKNNEYFEFSFTVNEMFHKFVYSESSDDDRRSIRNRVKIFPLPFKHFTFEFLNVSWVALRAQMNYKFCLKRPF